MWFSGTAASVSQSGEFLRLERNRESNAAYLRFFATQPGEVDSSVAVNHPSSEVALVVDFASDGRVLGIEFLNAAAQLPER
ncbi:DUF2283 domain-containing protein [Amycolatopsis sp. NPDC059021]|uniref:DUF2283 domain-containing protein n=1 Tax=Amycolatopsis sp. NPDC059021 TaxID=3346704 RepID=UPI0036725ABA